MLRYISAQTHHIPLATVGHDVISVGDAAREVDNLKITAPARKLPDSEVRGVHG
jgi:hypothetical protein